MNINKTIELISNIELDKVKVIAVSKYQSDEDIDKLVAINLQDFAENTEQNLTRRHDKYPIVNWHFIGRIQSNKIKRIVASASLIHSVASIKQLTKIDAEAQKINKVQPILIQINIANEKTKAGINVTELEQFINQVDKFSNIDFQGFMVIGDHTEDQEKINTTFKHAKQVFEQYSEQYNLSILSMGMSNDYRQAITAGSTHVRLGSILFND